MICKVIKKETVIQEPENVYDITVDNYHNFILSNGVIVHNCDTFMSAQIQQQLSADRFNVSTISVDRLDTQTHQCLPYAYFKSTLYDKRVEVYKDCDLLTEEVLGLERESDGHINHPENGTQGSKDQVDGIVGALWNASQNADEYAYEFGESLEAIVNVNNGIFDKQKAMQEELNKMMSARYLNVDGKDNGLLMPKTPDKKVQATVNFQNIANGIMVW